MKPMDVIGMATVGGARVLGREDIGTVQVGKAADLAAFALDDLGIAGGMHDPAAAQFMSWGRGRAEYTIVNGKVVVDKGLLVTTDVPRLIADANRIAARMIDLASKRTGIRYCDL